MPTISSDVLARYATDAAREVEGVRGLVESRLRIELHVAVEWGASIPEVGRAARARRRLPRPDGGFGADAVDVVVDEIGAAS